VAERRVDAVIFDMDGVLIDSGGFYVSFWDAWAAARGVDPAAVQAAHPGRPPADTIRMVAPHLDATSEAIQFNEGLAAGDIPGAVDAIPGAVELIGSLPDGRWTIATSAMRVLATRWLEASGIRVPPELVTVDDVANGKPAPDPYLLAAERLGVDPRRCVVIEDAPAGIAAANAASAFSLGVLSTHDAAALHEADALTPALSSVSIQADGSELRISWG
jgi:sugar-phosphatase